MNPLSETGYWWLDGDLWLDIAAGAVKRWSDAENAWRVETALTISYLASAEPATRAPL